MFGYVDFVVDLVNVCKFNFGKLSEWKFFWLDINCNWFLVKRLVILVFVDEGEGIEFWG